MALTDTLVQLGDAIREKEGSILPIPFLDMPNRVLLLNIGGDDTQLNGIIDRTISTPLNLTVATINTYSLYQCAYLPEIIAPKLTRINDNGCNGCIRLAKIYAPLLSVIGTSSLRNTALTVFDAPLTSIGGNSLQGSSSLTTLILRHTSITTLSNISAFTDTPIASGIGYIYVPSTLLAGYKVATNWVSFASQIRAIEDYPEIIGNGI